MPGRLAEGGSRMNSARNNEIATMPTALSRTWLELLTTSSEPISHLCATAVRRRTHHSTRVAVSSRTTEGLRSALVARLEQGGFASHSGAPRVGLVFCGQGPQRAAMGLELYAKNEQIASPTVTAIKVPSGWTWERLDCALRERGVGVGGSYGPLAGKVFRIGHMGSQADKELVKEGMDILEDILSRRG